MVSVFTTGFELLVVFMFDTLVFVLNCLNIGVVIYTCGIKICRAYVHV